MESVVRMLMCVVCQIFNECWVGERVHEWLRWTMLKEQIRWGSFNQQG
jgi:hypothetical protein